MRCFLQVHRNAVHEYSVPAAVHAQRLCSPSDALAALCLHHSQHLPSWHHPRGGLDRVCHLRGRHGRVLCALLCARGYPRRRHVSALLTHPLTQRSVTHPLRRELVSAVWKWHACCEGKGWQERGNGSSVCLLLFPVHFTCSVDRSVLIVSLTSAC